MNNSLLNRNLANLNFGNMNLRSLNASNVNRNETFNKIDLCLAHKPDILFITETKLHSKDCKLSIEKYLKFHSNSAYEVHFNSNSKSRGVGIIYKSVLNLKIISKISPNDENSLILKCKLNDIDMALAVVYPPSNANLDFFNTLKYNIDSTQCKTKVIGGDFNSLISPLPPSLNIELDNHPTLPNPIGSKFISDWMLTDNLIDPFRFLHYDRKEFSYEKKIRNVVSKSRIDFFLLSQDLCPLLKDANYKYMSRSRFDHKYCFFSTLDTHKKIKKPNISSTTISSPEFLRQTKICVVNCLFENSARPSPEHLSNAYETLNKLNSEIISIEKFLFHNFDKLLSEMLYHKIECFNSIFDSLNISHAHYSVSISPVDLLRLIINDIKNIAINISSNIKKKRCIELRTLESKLTAERQLSPPDHNRINKLTSQIESLIEVESNILCRHRSTSNSSKLEKDPKVFGSLFKIKSNATTDLVKQPINDEFIEFENSKKRNDFIFNFYKQIYRGSFQPTLSFPDFIENKTPNPIPSSPNLEDTDISLLSKQISLKELTDALFASKNKTSVGLDMISSQLLQNIYPTISPYLLNAFNSVFNHREDFPLEFKTSYIRLIPKSNCDPSNIKSWRPISIGSAIYKLYSKILSNRLSQILPSILNHCQKAYIPERNISELILNITENFASAIRNNHPMYAIAIDIAKAFDSLSHKFIIETLKYFKFPVTFINVIKTWLSNRKSCIIFPQGQSDFFDILNGVPQGDSLSGFIFILCLEMLNIKFHYSNIPKPNIKLPYDISPLACEFFADDSSFFIDFNPQHLHTLKSLLNEFYSVSGLALNLKKTKVMIIGTPYTLKDVRDIEEVGFSHTNSTTILGFQIDEKLENLDSNWNKILNSLQIISNTWSSHRPSLSTKIDLIKMFFLSKISYPASCLLPPPQTVEIIETIIMNFLFPARNTFPKQRVFSPTQSGGLGIPNIKLFCSTIYTKTAMRAIKSVQPWALSLKQHFPRKDITLLTKVPKIAKSSIPNMVLKLNEMNQQFYKINFYCAPLFHSPVTVSRDNPLPLPPPQSLNESNFIHCVVLDIFNFAESRILTTSEINRKFNIIIPYLTYFRLYAGIKLYLKTNIPPSNVPNKMSLSFLYNKNPQCKYIYQFFKIDQPDLSNLTPYKYFNNICPEQYNFDQTSMFFSLWNLRYIPNYIRNFILLRNNNKLLLNNQLSKFLDISPSCTFCSFFPCINNLPKETVVHIFFDCRITQECLEPYFNNFIENHEFSLKNAIFKGFKGLHPNSNLYFNIEISIALTYIYISKSKKRIPTFPGLVRFICTVKKDMTISSQKYASLHLKVRKLYNGNFKKFDNFLENLPT